MFFVHPQIKLNKALKAKLALVLPVNERKLKERLAGFLPGKQFVFTDMGRTAFRLVVEKMNLRNSTMILPAYICDIFYPILKEFNIKPIFVDIDLATFQAKIDDIRKKITPEVKAILVCHTYGLPVDVGAVREVVGSQVLIIEDCAHALFAQKDKVPAGNFGDISFFSLYKQIPALRGGMLVCPKDWNIRLPGNHFSFRDLLSFLNYFWPFAYFFKKFGSEYARTHLREEKMSEPSGIVRASLSLFSAFFGSIQNSLAQRKRIALLLQEELKNLGFSVQEPQDNVFCYLSALVPANLRQKRDAIVLELRKYRVFCTRIWSDKFAIIFNEGVQKDYQINPADFPNTVETAQRIVNFPLQNHYREKDVKKIIKALKEVMLRI
jgi:dTDP-4-amino-4,6-dideoxygalactose transaminase